MRLRDEHIKFQDQEVHIVHKQQHQVIVREEQAKKRVAKDLKDKRSLIKRRQVRQTLFSQKRKFTQTYQMIAFPPDGMTKQLYTFSANRNCQWVITCQGSAHSLGCIAIGNLVSLPKQTLFAVKVCQFESYCHARCAYFMYIRMLAHPCSSME